jgi:hypothetical protein
LIVVLAKLSLFMESASSTILVSNISSPGTWGNHYSDRLMAEKWSIIWCRIVISVEKKVQKDFYVIVKYFFNILFLSELTGICGLWEARRMSLNRAYNYWCWCCIGPIIPLLIVIWSPLFVFSHHRLRCYDFIFLAYSRRYCITFFIMEDYFINKIVPGN